MRSFCSILYSRGTVYIRRVTGYTSTLLVINQVSFFGVNAIFIVGVRFVNPFVLMKDARWPY